MLDTTVHRKECTSCGGSAAVNRESRDYKWRMAPHVCIGWLNALKLSILCTTVFRNASAH